MTFRARLILLGGGLAILSVLLTSAFQTWHARQDLIHAAERQGLEIGRLLGHSAWATFNSEFAEPGIRVHDLLDVLLAGENIRAVWILDDQDRTVAVGHGTMTHAELTDEERGAARRLGDKPVSFLTDTALTIVTPSIPPGGGAPWTVVLRMERAELDKSLLTELLIGLAVFLAAALATVIVMSQISRWLSEPVRSVAAAAAAVEDKSFTADMLAAIAARRDEFGHLAQVFTRMARDVLGREETLEGLVRERTHELAEKNAALEAANARIAEELRITQRMQISILPTEALEAEGARVFARMVPAREVGGDFYDFMRIDEDRIAVVIGDVSGKGVPAAFFMAVARTVLRRLALSGARPGEIMARANDELCEVNPLELFVTAFLAILDQRDGSLVYANAGHNPPCRIARDGTVTFLKRTGGMALGVAPGQPQDEETITLAPGETVFLYTDGVTEAFDADGAQFEEARMLAVLKQPVAGESLVERMIAAVDRFSGGVERSDDVTVLSLDRPEAARSATMTVSLANRTEELQRLAAEIANFAEANGLSAREVLHLDMALEEIVANAINYGYAGGDVHDGAIDVFLSLADRRLAIRVSDDGRAFNPLVETPAPDLDSAVDDRRVGGLGVHLVRTVMTDLRYTRVGDRNVIEMVLDVNAPA